MPTRPPPPTTTHILSVSIDIAYLTFLSPFNRSLKSLKLHSAIPVYVAESFLKAAGSILLFAVSTKNYQASSSSTLELSS
jgi:hypothetical protein